MIDWAEIINFQSIEHIRLDFSKGINVIRGKNRNGKSATLRAMRALVTNPRGVKFIRDGKPFCQIKVCVDGTVVEWTKSRSGSGAYKMYKQDGTDIEYGKVAGLPQEVAEVLKMGMVKLDEDLSIDLNFSSQMDPPFLVGEKKTVIAKVLGRVSFVNVIQNALRLVNRDLLLMKKDRDRTTEEIQDKEQKLKSFVGLDQLEQQLKAVDDYQADLDNKIKTMEECTKDFQVLTQLEEREKAIQSFLSIYQTVDFKKFKELESSMMEYRDIEKDVADAEALSAKMKSVGSNLERSNTQLQKLLGEKKTFEETWKVCPVCNRPWDGGHLHDQEPA